MAIFGRGRKARGASVPEFAARSGACLGAEQALWTGSSAREGGAACQRGGRGQAERAQAAGETNGVAWLASGAGARAAGPACASSILSYRRFNPLNGYGFTLFFSHTALCKRVDRYLYLDTRVGRLPHSTASQAPPAPHGHASTRLRGPVGSRRVLGGHMGRCLLCIHTTVRHYSHHPTHTFFGVSEAPLAFHKQLQSKKTFILN